MTQATQAHPLRDLITRHRRGEAVGIASVCSAHPLVLEAAATPGRRRRLSAAGGGDVQPGGPVRRLHRDAARGLRGPGPRDRRRSRAARVSGRPRWRPPRSEPLAERRRRAGHGPRRDARRGLRRRRVRQDPPGLQHGLRGGPVPAARDAVVAERAARCARPRKRPPTQANPVERSSTSIGTEVPVPGGAHEDDRRASPPLPRDARATLAEHRAAFAEAGAGRRLGARRRARRPARGRVRPRSRSSTTTRHARPGAEHVVPDEPGLVFEAHSTDYQPPRTRGPGPRPLGRPQGRARPHLRPARGALRPRAHRGRAGTGRASVSMVEAWRR